MPGYRGVRGQGGLAAQAGSPAPEPRVQSPCIPGNPVEAHIDLSWRAICKCFLLKSMISFQLNARAINSFFPNMLTVMKCSEFDIKRSSELTNDHCRLPVFLEHFLPLSIFFSITTTPGGAHCAPGLEENVRWFHLLNPRYSSVRKVSSACPFSTQGN